MVESLKVLWYLPVSINTTCEIIGVLRQIFFIVKLGLKDHPLCKKIYVGFQYRWSVNISLIYTHNEEL